MGGRGSSSHITSKKEDVSKLSFEETYFRRFESPELRKRWGDFIDEKEMQEARDKVIEQLEKTKRLNIKGEKPIEEKYIRDAVIRKLRDIEKSYDRNQSYNNYETFLKLSAQTAKYHEEKMAYLLVREYIKRIKKKKT